MATASLPPAPSAETSPLESRGFADAAARPEAEVLFDHFDDQVHGIANDAKNDQNGELLVLMRVNSPQPVREDFSPGDRMSLQAGASGTVLRTFAGGIDGTPPEAFSKLPVVVIGGINPEVGAISAPIFEPSSKLIGVISVSGPKSRFSAPMADRFCKLLMTEVTQLALATGVNPDIYSGKKRAGTRGPSVSAA